MYTGGWEFSYGFFEPLQTCELAVGHVNWQLAMTDFLHFLMQLLARTVQSRFAAAKVPDQVMSEITNVERNLMDKTSPSRGKSPCLCLI